MKRCFALVLSFLFMLAAAAAFAKTDGDFEYTLRRDGSAKITGYKGNAAVLEIPGSLGGHTVAAVEREAFRDCTALREAVLPETITYFGSNPFRGCTALEKLSFSGNCKDYMTLDGVLFSQDGHRLICYPLGKPETEYAVPDGTRNICPAAFCGSRLARITLPESVTFIGTDAFRDCAALADFRLPAGLTDLGAGAFRGCTALASLDIPGVTTTIGANAFDGCTALAEMRIPSSVTEIGDKAFRDCGALTLKVEYGSRAARYAKANSIPFVLEN